MHQHISWLQISVDDLFGMDMPESQHKLLADRASIGLSAAMVATLDVVAKSTRELVE